MQKEIQGDIVINASATTVWNVIGPQFGDIAAWASIIKVSESIIKPGSKINASASGRICKAYPGGSVREELLEYDERAMRLRYEVTKGLPPFITYAENNWSVSSISDQQSMVESTIVLKMEHIAGTLLAPMVNVAMTWMGHRLRSDLKRYVEESATT